MTKLTLVLVTVPYSSDHRYSLLIQVGPQIGSTGVFFFPSKVETHTVKQIERFTCIMMNGRWVEPFNGLS